MNTGNDNSEHIFKNNQQLKQINLSEWNNITRDNIYDINPNDLTNILKYYEQLPELDKAMLVDPPSTPHSNLRAASLE